MIKGFRPYSKEELFNYIDNIEITRVENQIVTKYFNRVINVTNVSKIYEIFDIRKFMKDKIQHLSDNFNITQYKFIMKRGIQEVILISDPIEINGINYHKSFFILNSTDKSRKLNMNFGLYSNEGVYFVNSISNMSLCKKHLTGITQVAEDISISFDGETFDEQIDSIKSLVGERILFSKLREVIVDKDQVTNHRKFDAFKNQILNSRIPLTPEQNNFLRTHSDVMVITPSKDFSIDAFTAFNLYMSCFRNQDSYLVKKETERMLKITQCFIRDEKINLLLDLVD
jgi:hypothetical protein